jgi:flagellar motor switch protein FliN
MPASEIQKWIPVLEELWLTAACKILEEIAGAPFEVGPKSETEARRPLGACSEFLISGGFRGKVVFGIPAASREMGARLLQVEDGQSEGKNWDDFSLKTAHHWSELVRAETGLVCAVEPLRPGPESPVREDAQSGLFSTLKSEKIVLPVYLLAQAEESDDIAADAAPNSERDVARASAAATQGPDLSRPNLDLLLDIELQASLRFGGREMSLSEVLEMGPGDVVPLDRPVHAPVDLVVGDRIVARGEVVLVDGNYGLRVTEVAEPRKRLETVRCLF